MRETNILLLITSSTNPPIHLQNLLINWKLRIYIYICSKQIDLSIGSNKMKHFYRHFIKLVEIEKIVIL